MASSVTVMPTKPSNPSGASSAGAAISSGTTTNLYRCTPRQIRKHVEICLQAGRVPFIRSSPGMGKSSIVKAIAKTWNLKVIDERLSAAVPEDLNGLPRFTDDGRAEIVVFGDKFPIEGTPIPEGYDGWLLFLDEFNSSHRDVQAASYKLILDGMVGQKKLHQRVLIVCAGNLDSDKAITNNISTAMKSRLIHLKMDINHQEWLEDVAFAQDYDPRIIAYLAYKPSALMDFDPDSEEDTFCCPRTWEFVNDLLKVLGPNLDNDAAALLAGTITSGVAVDFIQFSKVFASMVKVEDIEANPTGCPVPTDNPTKYAVTCHMMDRITKDNVDALMTYINRFDVTFRILLIRSVVARNPELQSHSAVSRAVVELGKYLHGN